MPCTKHAVLLLALLAVAFATPKRYTYGDQLSVNIRLGTGYNGRCLSWNIKTFSLTTNETHAYTQVKCVRETCNVGLPVTHNVLDTEFDIHDKACNQLVKAGVKNMPDIVDSRSILSQAQVYGDEGSGAHWTIAIRKDNGQFTPYIIGERWAPSIIRLCCHGTEKLSCCTGDGTIPKIPKTGLPSTPITNDVGRQNHYRASGDLRLAPASLKECNMKRKSDQLNLNCVDDAEYLDCVMFIISEHSGFKKSDQDKVKDIAFDSTFTCEACDCDCEDQIEKFDPKLDSGDASWDVSTEDNRYQLECIREKNYSECLSSILKKESSPDYVKKNVAQLTSTCVVCQRNNQCWQFVGPYLIKPSLLDGDLNPTTTTKRYPATCNYDKDYIDCVRYLLKNKDNISETQKTQIMDLVINTYYKCETKAPTYFTELLRKSYPSYVAVLELALSSRT